MTALSAYASDASEPPTLSGDRDAPLEIPPPSLEKYISPAEKALADQIERYEIDTRLQPIVQICEQEDGPYHPDYALITAGYQDKDSAAYKGTVFFQLVSFSRGNIATETYFIPAETLIFKPIDMNTLRIASTAKNVSGVTGGFKSNGQPEPSYDFEGVDLNKGVYCKEPDKASAFMNGALADILRPNRPIIRYSIDIRSEVNLEGMCEYMHEEAKDTIAQTLISQDLKPILQIPEAPNNDMHIRLTPSPNRHDMAQNDCRYDIAIRRNWAQNPWFAKPARNQNYESGYELIFQSIVEIGDEFRDLTKKNGFNP